jgi:hypothetical protein
MRNMAEYRVFAKCTDNLANADAEIGVRVFKKTVNIIKKSPIQWTQHEKPVWNRNPR